MTEVQFTKMHGIGNDFVVIDGMKYNIPEESLASVSRQCCDRKFGIGGDGLIMVLPSRTAEYRMRMFNPDGSEAEMCGNGVRCFAKYLYDRKMVDDTTFRAETLAGVKVLKLLTRSGKVESVRVDMGQPRLRRTEIPMRGDDTETVVAEPLKADGSKFEITAVSMGNPHVIAFEANVDAFDLLRYGPAIETHKSFPQKTNVHVVQVLSNTEIKIRTWERGAGITLACGTGACASVVASVLNSKTSRRVTAHLPGGDLLVEWNGDNRVMMTGPATDVFEGHIEI